MNAIKPGAQAPVKGVAALISRWMPDAPSEELDWLADADLARIEQAPLRARGILYTFFLVLLLLLIWAAIAEVDEVTRGSGKVIPSRQVQLIQSLDGGVVRTIHVHEGQEVESGQLLVSLDATRSEAALRENRSEYLSLRAQAIRLLALAENRPFSAPTDLLEEEPELVEQERAHYLSSRQELDAQIAIAKEQLEQRRQEWNEISSRLEQTTKSFQLTARELSVTRPLVASGAVSQVELLRLERDVANLKGERDQAAAQLTRVESAVEEAREKLDEVELNFRNQQRNELSEVSKRISALRESILGLTDRVQQTEVRSPVRGTIKRLLINTEGGVVLPGREIMEIVPLGDTLLLEARINPKDIAFLRPEQQALVKFTAFDFVVYGGLEALVEHISADTVVDEEGNPFYIVRVRTLASSLGEDKPIIPGMVAEVDILTGKKTILAYLLKPVLRAKQYALSER